jgi:hypothetical protein
MLNKNQLDKNQRNHFSEQGSLMIYNVVLIFIFSVVMLGILTVATGQLRTIRGSVNKETAFQIAEAGVNYYQWHLAHFPADFWDGNASTTPGPYVHIYTDIDTGVAIGQYDLTITPPSVGSTIATIQSTAYTYDNPNIKRTIKIRYGIPSLAIYAFLTNSVVWIGNTEQVSGQMLSNNGIRFDGIGNAQISSAKSNYTCPSSMGCSGNPIKPGVWGSAPTSTQAFWQFPVSNMDFSSITADLATMKGLAQQDGGAAYLSPSNKFGYDIKFNSNGKVDIYIIKKLLAAPSQAWDINGNAINVSIDYDPAQKQLLFSQVSIPPKGIFYVEDNVWVEGVVKGRAHVVAAKLPYNANTAPKIFIPNSIQYAAYDGSNVLGLLSQQDVVVTSGAPTDLEVDAAMVAQNGSVQVYQYPAGTNIKNSITVVGSLASYGQWTWSYVNGGGTIVSGFRNTYTTYDTNLLYGPPPSFPVSSNGYQQISWESN